MAGRDHHPEFGNRLQQRQEPVTMGHFLPVIERRGLQHSVEVQKKDVGHGAHRHIGEVWRVHARCSARG